MESCAVRPYIIPMKKPLVCLTFAAFAVFALADCGAASRDQPVPDRPRPEELFPWGGRDTRLPAEHAAPLARVAQSGAGHGAASTFHPLAVERRHGQAA